MAPSTGAMVLHQPVKKWVFNVRATYQREAEKAVDQYLATPWASPHHHAACRRQLRRRRRSWAR
jgi:hypothetical protein